MRISFDDLRGRTVIDAAGRAVGEVTDVVIEADGWTVAGLRVKLRRDVAETLGVPHGAFRAAVIDIGRELLQGAGDTVVLRAAADALRQPAPAEPTPPVH